VGVVGLAIVSGRTAGWRRGAGHLLVGVLAVWSMQIHAIGVALAAAIALRYGVLGGWQIVRQRHWNGDALTVGAGLLIGAGGFYLTNLAPVGGLTAYLTTLVNERTQRQAVLFFLTWPSLFEGMIMMLAVLLTIIRRRPADRLYLSFLLPLLLALALLDTQGYRLPAAALFLVPVGMLLSGGDQLPLTAPLRVVLPLIAVLFVLLLRVLTTAHWPGIGAVMLGQPPRYLYEELRDTLRPLVDPADRVVAAHLLIWTLPDQPVLVSPAAEVTAQRRWNLSDPVMVWARVDPTLIIDSPAQTTFSPALATYLTTRGFIPCQSLTVQEVTFTLYRVGCG